MHASSRPAEASAVPQAQSGSPNFLQLLSALRAEHEREVGALVKTVQQLRRRGEVPRPPHHDGGSPAAHAFNSVVPCAVPCIPFMRSTASSAKYKSGGGPLGGRRDPSAQDEQYDGGDVATVDDWLAKEGKADKQPNFVEQDQEIQIVLDGGPSTTKKALNVEGQPPEATVEAVMWPVWARAQSPDGTLDPESWQTYAIEADRLTLSRRLSRGASIASRAVPSWPLHPQSKAKMIWDCMAPVALLYDLVMIPMQVFGFPVTIGQRVVEGLILAYWVCDMFVTCNTAYFPERGPLVSDYRGILRRYLRTWFVPDITITGFDLITTGLSWAIPEGSEASQNVDIARLGRFLRVARIARVLRFGRMAKMRELIYRIQLYFDSEAITIAWGIFLNIFTLLVLNHVTACIWYLIGSSNHEYTWLKVPFTGNRTYGDVSKWEVYFVSLHWSLTLFTPASMSVQPQNLHERMYAVICLMLAMVVFASFVSTVTAGMTRLRHLTAESVEQGYKLRKFLQENQISPDLTERVTRYVDIAMKSHVKRIPKKSVSRLKWLSDPLHVELMWELCAPTLKVHSFFRQYGDCHVAATRQLCFSAISAHPVSMKDTLFSSYGQATSMYFVKAGHLTYKRARGLDLPRRVRLRKSDWFVEHVIWMKWGHRGTMKACTECDLMAVDSGKFQNVSAAHPDVLAMASAYAAVFVQEALATRCCDIPQGVFDRQSFGQQHSLCSTDSVNDVNFTSDSDNDGARQKEEEEVEEERVATEPKAKVWLGTR